MSVHLMCSRDAHSANQNRKDLFSAFGKLILVRASRWTFLSCAAKKRSQRRPPQRLRPAARGSLSADTRHGVDSTRFAQTRIDDYPMPLVPRSAGLRGCPKNPCANSAAIATIYASTTAKRSMHFMAFYHLAGEPHVPQT
jgi:hypothetical protein